MRGDDEVCNGNPGTTRLTQGMTRDMMQGSRGTNQAATQGATQGTTQGTNPGTTEGTTQDPARDMMSALKRVAVLLKQSGIPFALAGSYAAYARGGVPSDHDIDFVLREQDVDRATTMLAENGLKISDPPEDWLTKAFHEGCLVDLIFRLPFGDVDDALLERADELRIDSVPMPVLSATDLLVAKLLSLSEHHCDLEPVLGLVRSLREQVDWTRVRNDTSGSPFARALLNLAHDLDLLPQDQLTKLTPKVVSGS